MNLRHLGDALDFWKGGLLAHLPLRNLQVLPMFTDRDTPSVWTPNRLLLYARLLGVPTTSILHCELRFTARSRSTYFTNANIDEASDLFADPDNGIEPPKGGDARHIRFMEIDQLLPRGSERVLLVYQHAFHTLRWHRVCLRRIVKRLNPGRIRAFGYRGGSVGMIAVSADRPRLALVHQAIHDLLSPITTDAPYRVSEIVPS